MILLQIIKCFLQNPLALEHPNVGNVGHEDDDDGDDDDDDDDDASDEDWRPFHIQGDSDDDSETSDVVFAVPRRSPRKPVPRRFFQIHAPN